MLPTLFLSHFHSNSKWDPVNFELPETRVCLEKFIFTYPWFLSALGELKHLVILAKALSILPPSCAQVSGPWVFTRHSSAGWKGKKKYPPPKNNPNYRLHFSTALCKHWFQCFPVLLLGCPASHCKSSHRSQQDASCWQAPRAWRLCICSETDK